MSEFQDAEFPSEFSVHAIDFPYIRRSQLRKYDDYFFFAFVRNPYDRVVSCYKNRITSDANNNTYPYIRGVDRELARTGSFFTGMSFAEFCRVISRIDDEHADPHFRSQHFTLCDDDGRLMMDFVGRLESFEEDMGSIMQRLGIE